jgi:serpin B
MSRSIVLPWTLGFLLLSTWSCANDPVRPDPFTVRAIPQEFASQVEQVVRANNAFTFDFYRAVRKDETGNLFCSPYSLATALSMTMAGAAGETDAEMRRVLLATLPEANLHLAAGALIASLNRGTALLGYELATANRVWAQEGLPFLDTCLDILRTDYLAELGTVDFTKDSESCRAGINAWVESRTHDRIPDLFPAGSIDANTRMVLANAIYFKGRWEVEFDPAETRDHSFRVDAARSVTVPIMHRELEARFGGDETVRIVELPYQGKDLSMLVILPLAEDGLTAVEESLSVEQLDAWMSTLESHTGNVYLPRFRFTAQFALNQVLPGLGMPQAFDPTRADFSDLDGRRDLSLQAVVHKAFIAVNEEGTEAAAATGVSVGIVSLPPEFRADHPFLFLIRDNVTGSVLFLGRVEDPS